MIIITGLYSVFLHVLSFFFLFFLCNKLLTLSSRAWCTRFFLWKLLMVLVEEEWQKDTYCWPLLVFLVSCCLYPLASSCAHTFSTMSERARHICFFFDYGALSFYSLGHLLQSIKNETFYVFVYNIIKFWRAVIMICIYLGLFVRH